MYLSIDVMIWIMILFPCICFLIVKRKLLNNLLKIVKILRSLHPALGNVSVSGVPLYRTHGWLQTAGTATTKFEKCQKICRKLDSTSKNCIKKNFFDYKLILKIDLDLKKSDRFYIFPKGHMVWMELNCFVEKSSSLKREWVPHLLVHNTNQVGTLVTIYIS